MRQKVLVTGSRGYLASLVSLYNQDTFEFVGVSRKDVDYSNPAEVKAFFSAQEFDLLFHTAANATTADCESDPEGTGLVNRDSAIAIAQVCQDKGKRLVFISTEQLFNGRTDAAPFDEETDPVPVTNYGRQKADVDAWMRAHMDNYVILRLSWQFGLSMPRVKASPNILGNTLRALRTHTPTKFTANERRCMTYAQHLANDFPLLATIDSGVYNFASANMLTTYEAARYIAGRLGATPGEIDELILPDTERYAERPRDFRLDGSKAKAAGFGLATFEEDVQRCLSDFGY